MRKQITHKKSRPSALGSFVASLGMTHSPFYIGKGKGDRYLNINRNGYHQKIKGFISKFDEKPIPYIIKDNLTEKEAFILEDKLIDIFGLNVYGGLLTNLDEGTNVSQRRYIYKDDYEIVSKFRKERFYGKQEIKDQE